MGPEFVTPGGARSPAGQQNTKFYDPMTVFPDGAWVRGSRLTHPFGPAFSATSGAAPQRKRGILAPAGRAE